MGKRGSVVLLFASVILPHDSESAILLMRQYHGHAVGVFKVMRADAPDTTETVRPAIHSGCIK